MNKPKTHKTSYGTIKTCPNKNGKKTVIAPEGISGIDLNKALWEVKDRGDE